MSDSNPQLNQAIFQGSLRSHMFAVEVHVCLPRISQTFKPIDQVPTEILTVILGFVCTQNLLQEYSAKAWLPPTKLSSPVITYLPALTVSAVCARWRMLSLALPGLWARLKLEIVESATASVGIMATLQLYLERSAQAPLSLDILIGYAGELANVNPPVLNLLLEHTSRWKNVRCSAERKLSETLFLPILEDLALPTPGYTRIGECFGSAPEIRTLTIKEVGHVYRHWVKLYRHTLTYLHFSLDYDEISMLKDLPNLTVLKLDISGRPDGFLPIARLLPRVKSFALQLDADECIHGNEVYLPNPLDAFIFPSLGELIIRRGYCFVGELTWPVRAFDEFLSRSSCTLTHLSINGAAISELDLITTLPLLPSLIRLEFDDYHIQKIEAKKTLYDCGVENPIASVLLSKLTICGSDSVSGLILVPKLQSLSIKLKGTSFDDVSFVKMVLSRWLPDPSYTAAGVASLRSLVLRLHEKTVDEDIYRPLFELDKVGMRWGREVEEEADLRPLGNLERMGMRVVITGKEYSPLKRETRSTKKKKERSTVTLRTVNLNDARAYIPQNEMG